MTMGEGWRVECNILCTNSLAPKPTSPHFPYSPRPIPYKNPTLIFTFSGSFSFAFFSSYFFSFK